MSKVSVLNCSLSAGTGKVICSWIDLFISLEYWHGSKYSLFYQAAFLCLLVSVILRQCLLLALALFLSGIGLLLAMLSYYLALLIQNPVNWASWKQYKISVNVNYSNTCLKIFVIFLFLFLIIVIVFCFVSFNICAVAFCQISSAVVAVGLCLNVNQFPVFMYVLSFS